MRTIFFSFLLDFDECVNIKYHDCSENAYCFNLRGTYTCSCREGKRLHLMKKFHEENLRNDFL